MVTNDPDENTGLPTAADRFFGDDVGSRRPWASEWEREHDWHHHVTGYKDAADVLLAHLENTGRDARKLGPPIAFLYRHHLELALKQVARQCGRLLGRHGIVPLSHKLDELWRLCLSLLVEVSAGGTDAEEVKQTTRLIEEFCRADGTSETFRYPEDKEGYPSLSGEIELEKLREVVGKISLLLDWHQHRSQCQRPRCFLTLIRPPVVNRESNPVAEFFPREMGTTIGPARCG